MGVFNYLASANVRLILTHPTEAEMAAAVSENLYALFRAMQVLPGCELVESDKLRLGFREVACKIGITIMEKDL